MAVLIFRVVIISIEHMRRFEEITVFLIFFQYLSAIFTGSATLEYDSPVMPAEP